VSDADVLRRGLLGLGAISILATATELVMLRHWTTFVQVIPFVVLGVLAVALALVAVQPVRARLQAGRVAAGASVLAALYGVYAHVSANYDAGPLDRDYSARWDGMSELARWWAAATGSVGPSPPVAPAALAFGALCLLLATLRHPALSNTPDRR
jgi:hypothetical protein